MTSLRTVDLRALQLVGIINVERLPFAVEINNRAAAFAMAVAGGFGAAKGQMHLCADGGRIYISDAGIKIAHGAERLVDVASVDGGRQAVDHAVGDLNGVIQIVAGDH